MIYVRLFLVWCVLSVGLVVYTWLYTSVPDSYGQGFLRFDEELNEYVVSDNGRDRVVTNLCWHSGAKLRDGLLVSFVCFGEDGFYVFPYELDEDTATFRGHILKMMPVWILFILGSCVGFVVLDVFCGEEKCKIVHAN